MRRTLLLLLLWALAGLVPAAEGTYPLASVHIDLNDRASLQRGAKLFTNYCMSCHSAKHMRYNRMAKDLQIPESLVKDSLMFTTDKIGNPMEVAMRSEDAQTWFGAAPPDLSVIARAHGPEWLYTFLMSFYLDPSRPTGVNNLLFRETAMPHVLWELQGWQKPITETHVNEKGQKTETIHGLELVTPGKLDKSGYQQAVRDLVQYLVYMGEPAYLARLRIGPWVMLMLSVFLVLAYLLKKEYWKDVH